MPSTVPSSPRRSKTVENISLEELGFPTRRIRDLQSNDRATVIQPRELRRIAFNNIQQFERQNSAATNCPTTPISNSLTAVEHSSSFHLESPNDGVQSRNEAAKSISRSHNFSHREEGTQSRTLTVRDEYAEYVSHRR